MKANKIAAFVLMPVVVAGLFTINNKNHNNNKIQVRDILTEDFSKEPSGRIVRKAAQEAPQNKVSALKAQVSSLNENGTRHLRFVAAIDSYLYDEVKFTISANNGGETKTLVNDEAVTTAYEYIVAAGETLSAVDAFGEEYAYFVAYTINNVPETAWAYEFTATISVRAEGFEEFVAESATRVISDLVDKDEMIINAPNATGGILYNNSEIYSAFAQDSVFENDVEIKFDKTSDITWVASRGAVEESSGDIILGNIRSGITSNIELNGDISILKETDTTKETYKIAQAFQAANTTAVYRPVVTIYSLEYIDNINDISVYWNNICGASNYNLKRYIKMFYQLSDSDEWNIIKLDDDSGVATTQTGNIGSSTKNQFNSWGYRNELTQHPELKGKMARVAFTYELCAGSSDEQQKTPFWIAISAIKINEVEYAQNLADAIGTATEDTTTLMANVPLATYGLSEANVATLQAATITTFETEYTNYYDYLNSLIV